MVSVVKMIPYSIPLFVQKHSFVFSYLISLKDLKYGMISMLCFANNQIPQTNPL